MEATIAWPLIGLGLMSGLFFFMRAKQAVDQKHVLENEKVDLQRRLMEGETRLTALQNESQNLKIQAARLETELDQQNKAHRERIAVIESAEGRLKETFQALSGEALRQSGETFLQMAEGVLGKQTQRAQGDLELRRQAVDNLVLPLQQTLANVELRMGEIEKQRVGAYQGLQEQITLLLSAQKNLQLEASHLASALKSPTTRGRWGELQLRRVVELSGMLAYCDFYEQQHSTNQDGKQLRPDMIVRLPGNRSIAIDSKAPLQAYMEAIDCDDDEKRKKLFDQHAQLLKRQVQLLGQKGYWEQLEGSPEFVLLFLPGEAFFSAALQADPTLIEYGAENRVLIATPTTLIALLRTTAYAWRQEDISKHAEEVSRLGRELYGRIADLSGHVADMGKGIANSVSSYNKLIGSLETRVLVSARRFQELKADDPKKTLREIGLIDEQPRIIQAPELLT
ncbi:MAG: DNA recombination protein RmuC [Chitinophagaceae bacterium]|nr:DNA recombination protein RmuC [Oligoflexus sp.]